MNFHYPDSDFATLAEADEYKTPLAEFMALHFHELARNSLNYKQNQSGGDNTSSQQIVDNAGETRRESVGDADKSYFVSGGGTRNIITTTHYSSRILGTTEWGRALLIADTRQKIIQAQNNTAKPKAIVLMGGGGIGG